MMIKPPKLIYVMTDEPDPAQIEAVFDRLFEKAIAAQEADKDKDSSSDNVYNNL